MKRAKTQASGYLYNYVLSSILAAIEFQASAKKRTITFAFGFNV